MWGWDGFMEHLFIRACVAICICIHMHVYIYIYVYFHLFIYIHKCVCVCVCVCWLIHLFLSLPTYVSRMHEHLLIHVCTGVHV